MDKVSAFLGILPSRAQTDLRKTTPKELQSFIENYDEVKVYLSGTKYVKYLEMG